MIRAGAGNGKVQDESVFPMSVLLLVSGLLAVAPLRLRRLRLSRLDLRKTPLVLLDYVLALEKHRCCFPDGSLASA